VLLLLLLRCCCVVAVVVSGCCCCVVVVVVVIVVVVVVLLCCCCCRSPLLLCCCIVVVVVVVLLCCVVVVVVDDDDDGNFDKDMLGQEEPLPSLDLSGSILHCLPLEIITMIIQFMEPVDMLALCQTNKQLNALCGCTSFWKPKLIELIKLITVSQRVLALEYFQTFLFHENVKDFCWGHQMKCLYMKLYMKFLWVEMGV